MEKSEYNIMQVVGRISKNVNPTRVDIILSGYYRPGNLLWSQGFWGRQITGNCQ